MSYTNFIPTVWSESIERELSSLCVFAEDCNTKYEGDVRSKGGSVKILGVGRPTIKTIDRVNAAGDIDTPEEVEDTSITMQINQMRYFNYLVGDIDKAQSIDGVMEALEQETSEGLAEEIDSYIGNLATDESVQKLYLSAPTLVSGTASAGEKNVLHVLDEAINKLYEAGVRANSKIVVTVSPRFYTLFKRAYIDKSTDNVSELKNGRVAKYGNVIVKVSNNIPTTTTTNSGDTDNIMIRTNRAIAYAKPCTHTEAYRPEKKFADAVKGYILFDAKVVRPKEVVNINVKFAN